MGLKSIKNVLKSKIYINEVNKQVFFNKTYFLNCGININLKYGQKHQKNRFRFKKNMLVIYLYYFLKNMS